MIKRIAIIFIPVIMLVVFTVSAQSPGTYVTHTLKTGETLSVLAKQFNTTVGDIMRLNGMHADSKLVIGSNIKIPAVGGNIVEEPKPVPEKPIEIIVDKPGDKQTHIVQKGETIFGISKQYNISTDQLRQWNNLEDNSLEIGQTLLISNANGNKPVTEDLKEGKEIAAADTNMILIKNTISQPENTAAKKQTVVKNNKKTIIPVAENTDKSAAEIASLNGKEGYFEASFGKDARRNKVLTQAGQAMSFKTEAGWADYKYYILMNDAVIGTVVKVIASNGKTAYAKVLWNLGDLKENAGLVCRLSNATVAALGINDAPFTVEISYY